MSKARASALAIGWTIPLCFLAAIVEGIDVQSAGVAAPKLAPAFHLTAPTLLWVFSASTVGLLIGAVVGGRLADLVGRKVVLIGSMLMFGVFSLATATAWGLLPLLAIRFLTGLGLGGAMPNMVALAAENSVSERRSLAIALMYCGMPLGGALASLVSLLDLGDWRVIFYVGGSAPLLTAPLLAWALPESDQFARLREAAKRAPGPPARRASALHALLGPGRAINTLLLWVTFVLTLLVLYLLLNWLPTLLVGRGLSHAAAAAAQITFNVGGAAGSVLIGVLMDRHYRWLTVLITYTLMAAALATLAQISPAAGITAAIATIIGATTIGAQAIVYAVAPTCYTTEYRGTGIGAAVGSGRVGSVLGPIVAGLLMGAGQGTSQVLMHLLPVILAAGVACLAVVLRAQGRTLQP